MLAEGNKISINGKEYTLGAKLGGGKEGSVFEIVEKNGAVVKIINDSAMSKVQRNELYSHLKWLYNLSIDNKNVTQIQTYNLRGTLNRASNKEQPKIIVPVSSLPTRIVSLEFKPGSDNTVELYMDGGWQFSFRIHNASTYVESSLKFDIQMIGMPASIISINCSWN